MSAVLRRPVPGIALLQRLVQKGEVGNTPSQLHMYIILYRLNYILNIQLFIVSLFRSWGITGDKLLMNI